MKNLLVAFAAILTLSSCSDDDTVPSINGNPNPNTVLIKKTVVTYPTSYVLTSNYIYEGTKVTQVDKSDGTHIYYTYSDTDQLTEVKQYVGDLLNRSYVFTYNQQNKLSKYTMVVPSANYSLKTIYTYNNNETIDFQKFTGDFTSSNSFWCSGTITMQNHSIVSVVGHFNSYTDTHSYTFDSKNSFDKNTDAKDITTLISEMGGSANKATYLYTSQDIVNPNSIHEDSTFSYTYNEQDYPVTETETDKNNNVIKTEYFY